MEVTKGKVITVIGIDTRSVLPTPYVRPSTYTARDRVRVMKVRASRGDAAAIAWMATYTANLPWNR